MWTVSYMGGQIQHGIAGSGKLWSVRVHCEVLGCIFERFSQWNVVLMRKAVVWRPGVPPGSQEQEIPEQGAERELLQAGIYVLRFPVTTSWS